MQKIKGDLKYNNLVIVPWYNDWLYRGWTPNHAVLHPFRGLHLKTKNPKKKIQLKNKGTEGPVKDFCQPYSRLGSREILGRLLKKSLFFFVVVLLKNCLDQSLQYTSSIGREGGKSRNRIGMNVKIYFLINLDGFRVGHRGDVPLYFVL